MLSQSFRSCVCEESSWLLNDYWRHHPMSVFSCSREPRTYSWACCAPMRLSTNIRHLTPYRPTLFLGLEYRLGLIFAEAPVPNTQHQARDSPYCVPGQSVAARCRSPVMVCSGYFLPFIREGGYRLRVDVPEASVDTIGAVGVPPAVCIISSVCMEIRGLQK